MQTTYFGYKRADNDVIIYTVSALAEESDFNWSSVMS